jgi:hypothetical protein
MNDLPRRTLSRIVARHGREICDAPKRLEALLRDVCGGHRREINIIVGALEERVAADLIASAQRSGLPDSRRGDNSSPTAAITRHPTNASIWG